MLRYTNQRFHYGNISFRIPDGYFLSAVPGRESDNNIVLYSPDQSFSLELWLEEDCDGSKEELAAVIHDLDATVVYPIAPITVNGLSGHHATYRGLRTQYYEAWFDVDATAALSMIVETHGDILDIDTAAIVAAVDPRRENESTCACENSGSC